MKLRLFFRGDVPLVDYGDTVAFSGVAFVPYYYKNPGSFNPGDYMNREGIALYVKVRRWRVVEKGRGLLALLHRFRIRLVAFAMSLDEPYRGFLLASVLGERSAMGHEATVFYRLGIGHILSISGLHFGIYIGIAYVLFLWIFRIMNLLVQFPYLLLPRRSAHLAALTVALVLLVLSGNHLPAQRAVFMYAVYVFFAVFLEREVELISLVTVALLVFLLYRPEQFTSPGFQYTFMAVLVLGILQRRFYRASHFVRATLASVLLPVVMVPIGAYHFHRVYVLASIFNALLIPVFSLIIGLSLPLFFLSFWFKSVFLWLLVLAGRVYAVLYNVLDVLSAIPGVVVLADRVYFWFSMAVATFVLAFILRLRLLFVLSLTFVFCSLYFWYQQQKNRVIFFDMGKGGEASLVVLDGRAFLVNAGGKGREGAKALYQALIWEGVKRIDKLVCLLKGHLGTSYIPYLRKKMRIAETDGCDFVWMGSCRSQSFSGVDFVCKRSDCRHAVCKVLGDGVFVGGVRHDPSEEGALKYMLEVVP